MAKNTYGDGRILRVAVVSDLHAYDRSLSTGNAPSFFDVSSVTPDPIREPTSGLLTFITEHALRADVLLVAGDLADKAHPNALRAAWAWVNKCSEHLGDAIVVATPGNHDLDSRYIHNSYDARGLLLQLSPSFPLPSASAAINDRFWARNFVIHELPTVRILIINSAAYHGGSATEIEHGRVSDHTLSEIRSALEASDAKAVNLLLCHHHPKQHHEIGTIEDYEAMKNGDQILELLGSGRFGDWIIVHGHRHFPKLEYAGGNTSPLIFAAGSISATMYPEIAGRVRNQFYLAEIETDHRFGARGQIYAWDWSLGVGWQPAARRGSGLPALAGFGWRGTIGELAEKVAREVTEPLLPWHVLIATIPELRFVLPSDLEAVASRLETMHHLHVYFGDDGVPLQIGTASIAPTGYIHD